jgi:hypothetical protein
MALTRREWLLGLPAMVVASAAPARHPQPQRDIVNRRAVVERHRVRLRDLQPLSPLSVGNGEFAFSADITGLQTFPDVYQAGTPLCTQSQWGWHVEPRTDGRGPHDLDLEPYDTYGRQVGYATRREGQEALFDWLRENPHRLHLGRIGLGLHDGGGQPVGPAALEAIDQQLDCWSGVLSSRFRVDGIPVEVTTACHPEVDAIGCEIRSPLIDAGRLDVRIVFPYGSPDMSAADWSRPDRHRSAIAAHREGRVDIDRRLDETSYAVSVGWRGNAAFAAAGPHEFVLTPSRDSSTLSFTCRFTAASRSADVPSADDLIAASRAGWQRFWTSGCAIDFDGSSDSRAEELERRVVLSQYLTAIQCAGSLPPQETGLTCNSWYGKFHLEMHWWHAVHFALWARTPLLERSLPWYRSILPSAQARARAQGYAGARWPKMVGPDGRDSPSTIGPLLIWQQPHLLSFAELCYQAQPTAATMDRYRDLVFETAAFMASFAVHDEKTHRYVLGPPVIPAQEVHRPRETWNPTYELAYWSYGLEIAQRWRERASLPRHAGWERVQRGLSQLPRADGVYLAHENAPDTFVSRRTDHPSMLAALGVLPGADANAGTMRATLRRVMAEWQWETTWGWDYPMIAMTAARLGEPHVAVDALMMQVPKNRYLANGHNWQRPNLPAYLPGNGGLLAAVALMCTVGDTGRPAGFPRQGWRVRWEMP